MDEPLNLVRGDGVPDKEAYPAQGDEQDPLDPNLARTLTNLEWEEAGTTAGSVYGFRVRAYNARGFAESGWSYFKSAGEPARMNDIKQKVEFSSPTTIFLTWTIPDRRGGQLIGYKIYRNNGPGTQIANVPDPTCGAECSAIVSTQCQACHSAGVLLASVIRVQSVTSVLHIDWTVLWLAVPFQVCVPVKNETLSLCADCVT